MFVFVCLRRVCLLLLCFVLFCFVVLFCFARERLESAGSVRPLGLGSNVSAKPSLERGFSRGGTAPAQLPQHDRAEPLIKLKPTEAETQGSDPWTAYCTGVVVVELAQVT